MAAPRLYETKKAPFELDTIKDLYNTFTAGFELAKEVAGTGKRVTINTGPIGAGGFDNNKYVVFVLQWLAAEHIDVDLKLWAYSDEDAWTGAKSARIDHEAIITDFDNVKPPNKTISKLLSIAQAVFAKQHG